MTCGEFEKIIHELAHPGALDNATAVIGRFHAQMCARCAARLGQAQLLAIALDTAAQDSARLDAPAGLESVLVSAFREYHRSLERTRYRERPSFSRWFEWLSVAAAAAALLSIGAWNFSHSRTNVAKTIERPAATSTNSTAGNNGASSSAEASIETISTQTDSASDFVLVPYGEAFAPGDSGMIVRVEMPRSALADLGYSVDATRAADIVQADLLLGDDGWPRAVRLVR